MKDYNREGMVFFCNLRKFVVWVEFKLVVSGNKEVRILVLVVIF